MQGLRARLLRLAKADSQCARFGAWAHHYQFGPRMKASRVTELERELQLKLPADYKWYLTELGDGGPGPGHGLLPLDHPAQLTHLTEDSPLMSPEEPDQDAVADDLLWKGAVMLADHGCCYYSLLVLRGPMAGQVLSDTRAIGGQLMPSHPSFEAWIKEWLDLQERFPDEPQCPAPPGYCSLIMSLQDYFRQIEQATGVEKGKLSLQKVKESLRAIQDGGVQVRNSDANRMYDEGDEVPLCPWCQGLVQRYVDRGMMHWEQLAPAQLNHVQRAAKA